MAGNYTRVGGQWVKMAAPKSSVARCRECKGSGPVYAGNLCEMCVNADTENAPTGRKANCADCKKYREVGASGLCSICGLVAANNPVRDGLECGTCHKSFGVLTSGGTCFRCAKRKSS